MDVYILTLCAFTSQTRVVRSTHMFFGLIMNSRQQEQTREQKNYVIYYLRNGVFDVHV